MKTTGIFLLLLGVILLCISGCIKIVGEYEYSNEIESYWNLSEKASSITKKIEGVDRFVSALESSKLEGKYNAIFMKTPDNSFDENFQALKSLQTRLHEIEKMDVSSFEYQTALQQITQQEQSEAGEMLLVFEGVWWKENHFMLWGWIAKVQYVICCLMVGGGLYCLIIASID